MTIHCINGPSFKVSASHLDIDTSRRVESPDELRELLDAEAPKQE